MQPVNGHRCTLSIGVRIRPKHTVAVPEQTAADAIELRLYDVQEVYVYRPVAEVVAISFDAQPQG